MLRHTHTHLTGDKFTPSVGLPGWGEFIPRSWCYHPFADKVSTNIGSTKVEELNSRLWHLTEPGRPRPPDSGCVKRLTARLNSMCPAIPSPRKLSETQQKAGNVVPFAFHGLQHISSESAKWHIHQHGNFKSPHVDANKGLVFQVLGDAAPHSQPSTDVPCRHVDLSLY
jgi:hypothetical protein